MIFLLVSAASLMVLTENSLPTSNNNSEPGKGIISLSGMAKYSSDLWFFTKNLPPW